MRYDRSEKTMMCDSDVMERVTCALAWLEDAGEDERPYWWQMAVSNLREIVEDE